MKYSQVPIDTFKTLVLNAGMLLSDFNPDDGSLELANILGATGDGVTFNATHNYIDFGDGIDNVKKNTAELKRLESVDAKMSGTYKSVTAELAKRIIGAADISGDAVKKIVPRGNLKNEDFTDVWWVGDYSNVNDDGETTEAGFLAIHLMKALSSSGFQLKSKNGDKGDFPFEYQGHYSIKTPDVIPYEIYIKSGTEET